MSTNIPLIKVILVPQAIDQGQHSISWRGTEKLLDKGLGYRKEWKTEANTLIIWGVNADLRILEIIHPFLLS